MENHPIPQDVTGFQFKLVGSLTLKQFGYIAAGCILAAVFWYAPLHFLIKAPLIILFGGSGAAFAFLPIEGRPLDLMLSYFIKALFTPNQYVYQKIGGDIAIFHYQKQTIPLSVPIPAPQKTHAVPLDPQKQQRLQAYLQQIRKQHTSPLDEKEQAFLQSLFAQSQQKTQAAKQEKEVPSHQQVSDNTPLSPSVTQAPLASTQQTAQILHAVLPKKEEHIPESLTKPKQPMKQEVSASPTPAVHKTIQTPQNSELPQVAINTAPPKPTPYVQALPEQLAKKVGLPHTPDVPNILLGIVRDPRGNILPNILVEVKDSEGNPVRAFKTNMLGQFASATPLANGEYTIVFEDPKGVHQFDTVSIKATGEILAPLEIISHDAREELRRALFNV